MTNLIGGGALLGLSALFYSQTLVERFAAAPLARNPMAFPRLLTILLAAGAAVVIAQALFLRRGTMPGDVPPALNWQRTAVIAVLTGAYFMLFDIVGFIPATLVFLPLAIVSLGYRNALVIVLVCAVTVPGLWLLFTHGFQIRPPGPGVDDLLRLLEGEG